MRLRNFKALGMQCAVILLIDNDSEGKKFCAAIEKLTKRKVDMTDPYVHIAGNLYMVLTPLQAGATESIIEDCFAQEIKNLNLGGKTFNPDNNSDSSRYFHKHILSEYIRKNAAKINFTGFVELLDRISAAIEAHQSQQAVAVARAVNIAGSRP